MNKCLSLIRALVLLSCFPSCKDDSYYEKADFARAPKADTHTHIYSANSAMADQAKADNFAFLDISFEEDSYMTLPKQCAFEKYQFAQNPGRVGWITAFSTKGFNEPGWTAKTIAGLKNDFDNGALGIKVWKNIGMTLRDSTGRFVMIDDPRFDSVFRFIVQAGKTVIGHLGEPRNCWQPIDSMTVINDQTYYRANPQYHMFRFPGYPSYDDQVKARDHLLEKNPDMVFVGAHLGSLEWSIDELAKRFDRFPHMAVDLTERLSHLQYQSQRQYEKLRSFMLKYQDRFIYGSDLSLDDRVTDINAFKQQVHNIWKQEWEYLVSADSMKSERVHGKFKGLHLPKKAVDKIFFNNATQWFKWTPKDVR